MRVTEIIDGGIEIPGVHWVICGGESGPGARPMHPDWERALRDDCLVAGVGFHFKQWGDWVSYDQIGANGWEFTREKDGKQYGVISRGDPGSEEPLFGEREFETRYPWDDRTMPCMVRVGKRAAGRLLDGCEWNGLPS